MGISLLKDINLKFAIIATLNKEGYYIEEAEKLKKTKSYSREYREAPFHSVIKEVYEYYLNLEIEENILNLITTFNPRGTENCYNLILKEWDGEDDTFDIKSLEGIELLTSMSTFGPYILRESVDISALLKCSALKYIKQDSIPVNDHTKEVVELLVTKGVKLI